MTTQEGQLNKIVPGAKDLRLCGKSTLGKRSHGKYKCRQLLDLTQDTIGCCLYKAVYGVMHLKYIFYNNPFKYMFFWSIINNTLGT